MPDNVRKGGDVPEPGEITRLLLAWRAGEQGALENLIPLVYSELHRIAQAHLRRERPGHSLQPSAIVNETYLKLVGQRVDTWADRAHFFAVASRLMRQILVDHARRKTARKRDGRTSSHIETAYLTSAKDVEVLAVDEALRKLGELDSQQAEIVEMRFFAGLTVEEVSAALDISPATVHRKWAVARAWLHRELLGSSR